VLVSSKKGELGPAPGTYEVNDNLRYQSTKVPFSSFKSSSKRMTFSPQSLGDLPGPADYHPYEETQDNSISRQIMPYLLNDSLKKYLFKKNLFIILDEDIILLFQHQQFL
jgi:hypothetical protein